MYGVQDGKKPAGGKRRSWLPELGEDCDRRTELWYKGSDVRCSFTV